MSDSDQSGGGDDDVSLPKATVYKLITEMLPSDVTCGKETRDLLIECCVEFIHLIASEANEICDKQSKKTIVPEYVLSALNSLGFESYVEEVEKVGTEHKQLLKVEKERKTTRFDHQGMSEEELIRQQQELFRVARERMQLGMGLSSAQSFSTVPSSTTAVAATATATTAVETSVEITNNNGISQ